MRIELPSQQADGTPNWIEFRDQLKVKDRLAVQAVARMEITGDTNTASFLEMQNDMRNALLGRIITSWSFPFAIPAENSFQAADMVLGELDLDDYAVLEQAVQPLMDKISGRVSLPDPKKQPAG